MIFWPAQIFSRHSVPFVENKYDDAGHKPCGML